MLCDISERQIEKSTDFLDTLIKYFQTSTYLYSPVNKHENAEIPGWKWERRYYIK
jgi:hypothetical protein